jgi:phosphoglycolate phosphatase-like HAD superfamily hydrolase
VTGIVFDFDGVIADTRGAALAAANMIRGLIDPDCEPFCDRDQYRRAHGYGRLLERFGRVAAETLTDLHPFLVRLRLEAEAVQVVAGVVELARELAVPPPIVTAGYAVAVERTLLGARPAFGRIIGREDGIKDKTLAVYGGSLLVTDTVTDVHRAHDLGLLPVAVSWGYDVGKDLLRAGAVAVVHNPGELKAELARWGVAFGADLGR